MTWLIISLIFSWILSWQPIDITDTWYIQEQFLIEDYFNWVDSEAPIIYRKGRVLWQPTELDFHDNKADCWWILIWYLFHLWVIKSKNTDIFGKTIDYEWMLNSYILYKLWIPKLANQRERGDFVYMEFPSWNRHIAIYCW